MRSFGRLMLELENSKIFSNLPSDKHDAAIIITERINKDKALHDKLVEYAVKDVITRITEVLEIRRDKYKILNDLNQILAKERGRK